MRFVRNLNTIKQKYFNRRQS